MNCPGARCKFVCGEVEAHAGRDAREGGDADLTGDGGAVRVGEGEVAGAGAQEGVDLAGDVEDLVGGDESLSDGEGEGFGRLAVVFWLTVLVIVVWAERRVGAEIVI